MLASLSRPGSRCSSRLSSLPASLLTSTCKLKTRVTREIHCSPLVQSISASVRPLSFASVPATASQPHEYTLNDVIGPFGRQIQSPE